MADADTFAEFYRDTYRGLVAQLVAYTGDLGEAQDVAQEVYVRAWSRWQRISAYDDPRAWIGRVGHNLVISRWRRARTAFAGWTRHGPPAPVPEPDPATLDLVAALRRLPEPQRRALVLYHLGGFAVAEIARMEGAPENTVKARLARGRQALAPMLTVADPAADPAADPQDVRQP
ncbi:sigma factor-like helix-turn-helix DNA-binding protein [Dactylosporangium sp. NPDC006015]|uniref:RNA polymerase sigma factor n=1 Tax=Dactylosporangium sp. NPDC006015 TaxID=3154576 RepID=UPI0033A039FD